MCLCANLRSSVVKLRQERFHHRGASENPLRHRKNSSKLRRRQAADLDSDTGRQTVTGVAPVSHAEAGRLIPKCSPRLYSLRSQVFDLRFHDGMIVFGSPPLTLARRAQGDQREGLQMESVVGIFNSFADARRAAAILQSIGISESRITVLSPRTRESEIEAAIPTTDTEQPGMGAALGGTVGAALGVAGGLEAGAAVASLLIPGVGPVLAFGLLGAAIFGAGGAAVGTLAGHAIEDEIAVGIPRDELFVYEDALRRGRTVVIAFPDNDQVAARAREVLHRAAAESVDAAREEWWIGLRDAEGEHYTRQGGDFNADEAKYRLGFEAAIHPDCRGKNCEDMISDLNRKYGSDAEHPGFREGYVRGQNYLVHVIEIYKDRRRDGEDTRKAA